MRNFWKGIGIALVSGLGALVVVGLSLPVFGRVGVKGLQTKNLRNAKQLGLATKLYAMDHGGRFPMHLSELTPEYIPALSLDQLLYEAKAGDEKQPRLKYDWLYFGAFFDEAHPPSLLIASPHVIKDGVKHKRVVIYANGSGSIVKDDEYEAELRQTIDAMRQRFDERASLPPPVPKESADADKAQAQ